MVMQRLAQSRASQTQRNDPMLTRAKFQRLSVVTAAALAVAPEALPKSNDGSPRKERLQLPRHNRAPQKGHRSERHSIFQRNRPVQARCGRGYQAQSVDALGVR